MEFDVALLTRLQALAALAVQSVFPSLTIGLASWLAVLEGLWLGAGSESFRRLYRTWIRVFAAVFVAAVATALATPPASRLQLVLELVAFGLETGLVAVMLFGGRARASHFAATVALAVGSVLFAAAWPGAPGPVNLARLVLAAYLATAVLVAAVSAWRLMRDITQDDAGTALKMAIGMLVICAPLEIAAYVDLDAPFLRLRLALVFAALALGLWGGVLVWRTAPERSRLYLGACVAMLPVGLATAVSGWAGLAAPS
jgi:cytochrome d ubiquinol oxidase subunit I